RPQSSTDCVPHHAALWAARGRGLKPHTSRIPQAVRGNPGTIFAQVFLRKFLPSDAALTLSPAARGTGQGEEGRQDGARRGAAHLTFPLRGPLPLPPEGRTRRAERGSRPLYRPQQIR